MDRLPKWIRRPLTTDQGFNGVHGLIKKKALHTVCESARCPNRHECWNAGTATIMLLGDICTRTCRFCAVRSGKPLALDRDEPRRVAEACRDMRLQHVVLTSVNRDDLPDGGAAQFAETILAIRKELPDASIEVLTPDFEGSEDALEQVLRAQPEVFSHNIETVRRFQPVIRPQASYGRSLATLRFAAAWNPRSVIKSGIMLGLGESEEELFEAMQDLVDVGCDLLTLGQYLRPTVQHAEVSRYVEPAAFERYARKAKEMGFKGVASGPMVRSSYKAEELFREAQGHVVDSGWRLADCG